MILWNGPQNIHGDQIDLKEKFAHVCGPPGEYGISCYTG